MESSQRQVDLSCSVSFLQQTTQIVCTRDRRHRCTVPLLMHQRCAIVDSIQHGNSLLTSAFVWCQFKDLWGKLGIRYDSFVRTTDPKHEAIVREFFQRVWDKGDIYKKDYTGESHTCPHLQHSRPDGRRRAESMTDMGRGISIRGTAAGSTAFPTRNPCKSAKEAASTTSLSA